MKAKEVQEYLRSLDGGWMDMTATVDTFKSGDPDTEITGIAVSWMSAVWALEQALAKRANLFITHEPTYYHHTDNDPAIFRFRGVEEKRRFIEANHLVILRCHDLWDQIPEIGIPDTWANLLNFGQAVDGSGYYRVYQARGETAYEIASQIAARTRQLGQEAVQLIGPGDKPVQRVCLGTGAITPFLKFVEWYNPDLAICSDDGITYWRDGAFAIDMGIPIIVVNHTVTEEAGMASLAKHLQSHFPAIPVYHIPQSCMYRLVFPPGGSPPGQA